VATGWACVLGEVFGVLSCSRHFWTDRLATGLGVGSRFWKVGGHQQCSKAVPSFGAVGSGSKGHVWNGMGA
jgi:hypothetical protein